MISFIWPRGAAMLAGTGGSETFTAGHVRELNRRGIPAQVVSVGHGKNDGRKDFKDVPFLALDKVVDLEGLAGTIVFVNRAYPVRTKHKSVIILHCVTPSVDQKMQMKEEIKNRIVIATSIYSAQKWALYLDVAYSRINVVMPFADPIFGNLPRKKATQKIRITYAGRLHPEKGIYTLLEAMHAKEMQNTGYAVSIVMAGQHVEIGQTIAKMLHGYPYAKLLHPAKTISSMAEVLTKSDILLVPSVYAEPFGMLSIEAQHAGCRVVASNIGGLPETNCGLLTLIEPRNPKALIGGIKQAVALGQATKKEREFAKEHFTLDSSVEAFLKLL